MQKLTYLERSDLWEKYVGDTSKSIACPHCSQYVIYQENYEKYHDNYASKDWLSCKRCYDKKYNSGNSQCCIIC